MSRRCLVPLVFHRHALRIIGRRPDDHDAVSLWGSRGYCNFEVVGETFREREIRAVLPKPPPATGIEFDTDAELIPEPHNRHDPNAVAVVVSKQTVGYLAKEEAPRYQPVLLRLIGQGFTPVVPCRIWAREESYPTLDDRGRERREVSFYSRITIALSDPHMLVPLNLKPSAKHILLPFGAAVQVTGEESRMTAITPWLRSEGEGWVHASLHPIILESTRTPKTLVEVRIDGAAVGVLTPKMSTEYLPAIEHFGAHGITTAVRAIVKGNRLKAEVVLYGQRAHELDAGWLDSVTPSGEQAATSVATDPIGSRADSWPPEPRKTWRFNPPPGWPTPPDGWSPPPGWRPPNEWPTPPADWQYWI